MGELDPEFDDEQRRRIRTLLTQYQSILSMNDHDIGRTHLVERTITQATIDRFDNHSDDSHSGTKSLSTKKQSECWNTVLSNQRQAHGHLTGF